MTHPFVRQLCQSFPLVAGLWAASVASGQAQAPDLATLGLVVDAITVELNETSLGEERAILVRNPDEDVDLYILAAEPDDARGKVLVHAPGIAYSSPMAGDTPSLEVSDKGSLRILSGQSSVGRNPWTEVLTLVERDGAVIVAGVEQNSYDRLFNDAFSRCDWNLLTGDFVHEWAVPEGDDDTLTEGKEAGKEPRQVRVENWAAETEHGIEVCNMH